MKEWTKRKDKPEHDDVDFIEALGDVIRSARQLQSRLLRTAANGEIISTTRDRKLQRDLSHGTVSLDLARDQADFDQAMKRVAQVRPPSSEEMNHPLLMSR